ncbi:cytosolic pyruvate kinase [Volvox carteri f. nagariensis]|uniref:Pyruvate kinase n=1 Tax=Volvox carteri f. nagariensis TaxID=3068 RepID=D8UGK6_VOLCA|nr:cytosolic pyruvate kinase [Volvox carteri f. nagariensis]EFJ41139.1 cytosolic pyruvate kinase [Volvox carteri f. nagariensis]|eukprot:XP_002957811.1 cytosolic pyruvate kinase [Volvox carteri f. nagariensis]
MSVSTITWRLSNCHFALLIQVVCTLGPKSRSVEVLEELLRAGMSVARFNFSHGSHDYHQETLDNLRIAMNNTKLMCAAMLDTKGPEIRTGTLKDGKPVQLTAGREVTITTDYAQPGDENTIAMSYKKLAHDVKPGSQILCADGSIVLEVISTDPAAGTVRARCMNSAMLGERKNVNLPGVVVDLPTLTEKDVDDIIHWAIPNDIDFIAASFVRKGSDIDTIRQVLGERGRFIKIISKVENQEGIQNFDDILLKTDAVMVARGDLGMEIPTEKIFLAQKMMIQKCNYAGKPVITATQMLESMIKNPRPTRAEATDVANAVLDGTDCVMLSGETAAGNFPVEAVKVMTKICREAEASLDYYAMFKNILKQAPMPMSPLESLASSAVRTAHKVHASLIVVLTREGSTARLVAKYRPLVPVLTVAVPVLTTDSLTWTCSGEAPARQCLVTRGLIPVLAEGSARATDSDTTDEILAAAIEHAKRARYCAKGDSIVALHRIGNASVIKIVDIK